MQYLNSIGQGKNFLNDLAGGRVPQGTNVASGVPALTGADYGSLSQLQTELSKRPAFDAAFDAAERVGNFQAPGQGPSREEQARQIVADFQASGNPNVGELLELLQAIPPAGPGLPERIAPLGIESTLDPAQREIFNQFRAAAPDVPLDIALDLARNPAAYRQLLEGLSSGTAPPGTTPPTGTPYVPPGTAGGSVLHNLQAYLKEVTNRWPPRFDASDHQLLLQFAADPLVKNNPQLVAMLTQAADIAQRVSAGVLDPGQGLIDFEGVFNTSGGQTAGQQGGQAAGQATGQVPIDASGDFNLQLQFEAQRISATTGVPFNEVMAALGRREQLAGRPGYQPGGGEGYRPSINPDTGRPWVPDIDVGQSTYTGGGTGFASVEEARAAASQGMRSNRDQWIQNALAGFKRANPTFSREQVLEAATRHWNKAVGESFIQGFDPNDPATYAVDPLFDPNARTEFAEATAFREQIGAPVGTTAPALQYVQNTVLPQIAAYDPAGGNNLSDILATIQANPGVTSNTARTRSDPPLMVDEPTVAIGIESGEPKFTMAEPTQEFPDGIPELVTPAGNGGINIEPASSELTVPALPPPDPPPQPFAPQTPAPINEPLTAIQPAQPASIPPVVQSPALPTPVATPAPVQPRIVPPSSGVPKFPVTTIGQPNFGQLARNLTSVRPDVYYGFDPVQRDLRDSILSQLGIDPRAADFFTQRSFPQGLDPSRILTPGF